MAHEFFCDKLVYARVERGLKQKEVAEQLGITVRAYQAYEYGDRVPTSDVLLKIINFFQFNIFDVQKSIENQKHRSTL